jgi:uncharacterized protein YbjQ (UPF0145 family)
MLITTTSNVEGHEIKEYKGIVVGEVISGINFLKDFAAGLRNLVGGRSQSYEGELIQARDQATNEMVGRAQDLGANAIVGAKFDYETLGADNGMLMVTISGTAVVID